MEEVYLTEKRHPFNYYSIGGKSAHFWKHFANVITISTLTDRMLSDRSPIGKFLTMTSQSGHSDSLEIIERSKIRCTFQETHKHETPWKMSTFVYVWAWRLPLSHTSIAMWRHGSQLNHRKLWRSLLNKKIEWLQLFKKFEEKFSQAHSSVHISA
jgi:hypothetical protein